MTSLTTLLQGRLNSNYIRLAEQVTLFNSSAVDLLKQYQAVLMQYSYTPGEAYSLAVSSLGSFVGRQAYIDALDYALLVTVLGVVVSIVLVLFIKESKAIAFDTGDSPPDEPAVTI